MSLNLGVILQAGAADHPKRTAVKLGDRALSYGELDRAARGVATALRRRGVERGDTVAILIPNVPEFSIAYFGILYAGAVAVPINVLAAAPEVAYFLGDSRARLIVAHALFADVAREGSAQAGVPLVFAGAGSGEDTLEEMAASDPVEEVCPTDPDDTAVVLYTSGTTGKPKGAELTHSNLFVNCSLISPKLNPMPPGELTVALGALPLFHSFGQTCVQNATLSLGGTVVLVARFDAGEVLELIERERVNVFAGVPTMYFALLHYRGEREYDLSGLRCCLTGGAPMPVEVMAAFEERYPVKLQEGYGLSETSPVASFGLRHRPRKTGSIGYPVWGVEMCIVDEDETQLADGEPGEICIRGHNVMKGYLNQPESTKEALRGGWFHTGDIGYRDSDGCYWIVDRKKDMILRGGFNVYPREVEEVLYSHDAVAEAAVIGVPSQSHGEEVKAVVAFAPGKRASEDELIDFCRERLAAYKYPRIIQIVESLPKGPTGKILKRELRGG